MTKKIFLCKQLSANGATIFDPRPPMSFSRLNRVGDGGPQEASLWVGGWKAMSSTAPTCASARHMCSNRSCRSLVSKGGQSEDGRAYQAALQPPKDSDVAIGESTGECRGPVGVDVLEPDERNDRTSGLEGDLLKEFSSRQTPDSERRADVCGAPTAMAMVPISEKHAVKKQTLTAGKQDVCVRGERNAGSHTAETVISVPCACSELLGKDHCGCFLAVHVCLADGKSRRSRA